MNKHMAVKAIKPSEQKNQDIHGSALCEIGYALKDLYSDINTLKKKFFEKLYPLMADVENSNSVIPLWPTDYRTFPPALQSMREILEEMNSCVDQLSKGLDSVDV